MLTVAEQIANSLPRFKKQSVEAAYALFDAFVKAVFVDNKVIDFSKDPVDNGGSMEFATTEESFADTIAAVPELTVKASKAENADAKLVTLVEHASRVLALCSKKGKMRVAEVVMTPTTKEKNVDYILAVFKRFASSKNRASATTVEEAKQELLKFACKVDTKTEYAARHFLLHMCDPNMYPAILSVNAKMEIFKKHEQLYNSLHIGSPRYFEGYTIYYKDPKRNYYTGFTEKLICMVYDMLAKGSEVQNLDVEEFVSTHLM